MLYAILAYHVEDVVVSWTADEDTAVMANLHELHEKLTADGRMGPAARLGGTKGAFTLRGPGAGVIIDGPFAETKELIAGYTIIQVKSREEALEWARRFPNPHDEDGEIEIRQLFELEDFAPGEAIERFRGMEVGIGKTKQPA